jgi:glycosyltransferase involved in cell wall biosynthesis
MVSPGVSVIIPTRDRAALLRVAIESALAAVRPGDEVLVVDDGSTDDTPSVTAAYRGVRCVRTERLGPGAARNRGAREARQPLLAFLDSDDRFMPDKLELQRRLMERRPDVLFCFSDFAHRTRDGAEQHGCLQRWHGDPRGWEQILGPGRHYSELAPLPEGRPDFVVHVGDLYPATLRGDYVCTSTSMVRRETAALRFAEDLYLYEDWECFARLARAGHAAYLDCETQWNCDHAGERLTRVDDLASATARITVLQRVWGSDAEFLAQHGERYRERLASQRRARARALIALGRTREAREELRQAGNASARERVLARLPGAIAYGLLAARRRLLS